MQEKNLVSICLPNYNDAQRIGTCLEAILMQTYQNYELIIVDDGSTDHSLEVIQSYLPKFKRALLIQHPTNLGVNTGLRTAFSRVQGEWIYFGSTNDVLQPYFFEEAVKWLTQFPEAGFCAAEATLMYHHTEEHTKLNFPEGFISKTAYFEMIKNRPRTFIGQSCLYRSQYCMYQRFFMPELKWMVDTVALSHLAFRYGFCFIKLPMSRVEMRLDGFSSKANTVQQLDGAFNALIQELNCVDNRDIKSRYLQSGWLCLIGVRFFKYLLLRPALWKNFSLRYFINLVKEKLKP